LQISVFERSVSFFVKFSQSGAPKYLFIWLADRITCWGTTLLEDTQRDQLSRVHPNKQRLSIPAWFFSGHKILLTLRFFEELRVVTFIARHI
jgi:hypothetical protein